MNQIPEELLLRLSAHMDGQGNQRERETLENELRQNPEAARVLQSWQDQRAEMKSLYLNSQSISLPDGFADRVVDAAIDQACREGCDETHPLILAGQSPSVAEGVVIANDRGMGRRLLVFATLAASLLIAAWVGQNQILSPQGSDESVANRGDEAQAGDNPQALLAVGPSEDSVPPADVSVMSPDPMRIAADTSSIPTTSDPAITTPEPAITTPEPAAAVPAMPQVATAEADRIATVSPGAVPPVDGGSDLTLEGLAGSSMDLAGPDGMPSLGVLLVVQVNCQEGVDRDRLFSQAMQWAGIDQSADHEVDDAMVAVASETVESPTPFQLVFLNAPARKLDRLYLRLAGDRQQVESVGMSLATDMQLLELTDSISQDPTLIRDTAVAVQISGVSERSTIADQVEALTFLPITDGALSLGAQAGTGSGPDEIAQILFIVR